MMEIVFIDDWPGRVDAFHGVGPAEARRRIEAFRPSCVPAAADGRGPWVSIGPGNYSPELFDAAKEAGVRGVLLETLRGTDDLERGLQLAHACGLPAIVSATPLAGQTKMLSGEDISEFASRALRAGVHAVGLNCTTPAEMMPAARVLAASGAAALYLSPSAGIPAPDYPLDAQDWAAQFAALLRELPFPGKILAAGCCGTDAEFINELKKLINPEYGKEN